MEGAGQGGAGRGSVSLLVSVQQMTQTDEVSDTDR